jgi:hypothetical protein
MFNFLLNSGVLKKIDLKIVHYFIRLKFTYYGRMELACKILYMFSCDNRCHARFLHQYSLRLPEFIGI